MMSLPALQPLHPPLPPQLKHLSRPEHRPIHISSSEVAVLLRYWGFTKNGEEHIRKLIRCELLKPVRLRHQRGLRFLTGQVLAVWEAEKED